MKILKQNEQYILSAEKTQNKYWLELINKITGETQILICNTKKLAENFFNGCEFDKIKSIYEQMNIEPIKMYKDNCFLNILNK